MRTLAICLVVLMQSALLAFGQQAPSTAEPTEVVCTFDDGQGLKIQYSHSAAKRGEGFHYGKIWELGGSPMILFTQTAVVLGNSTIPAGAYSLYILPERHNWTLVVSRDITANATYDEKQDLGRAPMQIGQIDTPIKSPEVSFVHVAPRQCNLRVYYEQSGAWADFQEK